jgi:hypothetical protein
MDERIFPGDERYLAARRDASRRGYDVFLVGGKFGLRESETHRLVVEGLSIRDLERYLRRERDR